MEGLRESNEIQPTTCISEDQSVPVAHTALAAMSRDSPTGTYFFEDLEAQVTPHEVCPRRRLNDDATGCIVRLYPRTIYSCYLGPHRGAFAASNMLIFVPTLVYVLLSDSAALSLLICLISVSSLWSLWKTALTEPGILHRGNVLPDEADTPRAVQVSLPQEQVVQVPMQRRWCFTCNVLRPLRASHCEFCGVCVERRDHHCPWTGTCIGRRNYPYFVFFLCITSVSLVIAISTSLVGLITRMQLARQTGYTATKALMSASSETYHIQLGLTLFSCTALVFVGSLALYHINLSRINVTTREDLRKEFERGIPITDPATGQVTSVVQNPFDAGSWHANLHQVLIAPLKEEAANYKRDLSSRAAHASGDEMPISLRASNRLCLPTLFLAIVDRILCCIDRVDVTN